MVDVVLRAGRGLIDAERVQSLEEPTMAAEDFSFLAGTLHVAARSCLQRPTLSTRFAGKSRHAGCAGAI